MDKDYEQLILDQQQQIEIVRKEVSFIASLVVPMCHTLFKSNEALIKHLPSHQEEWANILKEKINLYNAILAGLLLILEDGRGLDASKIAKQYESNKEGQKCKELFDRINKKKSAKASNSYASPSDIRSLLDNLRKVVGDDVGINVVSIPAANKEAIEELLNILKTHELNKEEVNEIIKNLKSKMQ